MSFLTKNDSMILMNSNQEIGGYGLPFISMDTNELARLRDECGFTVVQEQMYWHDVERQKGQYTWTLPDKQVERVKKAGMKLILCAPITVPTFFPDDWYWAMSNGAPMHSGLSFWNLEAQNYQRDFCQMVIDRYSADDVSVIFHGFLGGESVMYNHPAFYDPHAIRSFEQWYGAGQRPIAGGPLPSGQPADFGEPVPFALDYKTTPWFVDAIVKHHRMMQDVFRKPHNEVWDDLQPLIGQQSQANGNFAQPDIHLAYSIGWPDVEQWLLMYTYFGNGPKNADIIDGYREKYGCKVIVEANYCEGLILPPPTYITAIEKGFDGQIVCPLHPFRGHKTVEPWMIEAMKKANDAWKSRP
jgi:hypothetical protein